MSDFKLENPFEGKPETIVDDKPETSESETVVDDKPETSEPETVVEDKPETSEPETVVEDKPETIKPETPVDDTSDVQIPEDGSKLHLLINFENNTTVIDCVITATNTKYNVIAVNKELRLLQNRFYFIPVSKNVNSDDFDNLKIFSNIAENIDVRYIKDGMACVIALKHNIVVRHNERICAIW